MMELPERTDTRGPGNQPTYGGSCLDSLCLFDPPSANNKVGIGEDMVNGPFEEEAQIAIRNDSKMEVELGYEAV